MQYDLSKDGVAFNVNFCYCCRRLLIPGANMEIRVRYDKKSVKRYLVYRCCGCKTEVRFYTLLDKREKKRVEERGEKESKSNDKQRNGKRRRLRELLKKKSIKKEGITRGKKQLDLFDFMK
ncbi:hypothetical protein FOA43_002496 [Brettanomyces nanus]|uniref:Uncharacterized protein n=1 Tax=Eeniella nana TaxID=13502 RepID=A0A875S045_EENNA|nr:uncharacterized protein FOA43_002496 [Brettanomyces nanus]QPG75151.1 hypothetical protein FOA43_002496 [Brettanomyces nanus]